MIDPQSVNSLKEIISSSLRTVIISHERPDGDSIASLLSIRELIQKLSSAEVCMVSRDGVPKAFLFLPGVEKIEKDFLCGDFDVVITVDCGDLRRTGYPERIAKMLKNGVALINVDHHPKNDLHKMATLNIVDYQAASATEIIYQLINHLDIPLNANLATILYTGLFTDTGSFQHPVTTPHVLSAASRLLASGARFKELRQHLTCGRSLPMLKLWGLVLERVKVNKYKFAVSIVSYIDLESIGASEEDLAGVVNLLESIPECIAAILLAEVKPGIIRGSIRSNNSNIDVSRLAKYLGGGGHSRAAGFTYSGSFKMDKGQWKVL